MAPSIFSAATLRRLWAAALRGLPAMIAYELIFRAFVNLLGSPLLAWTIGALVARTGSAAVGNTAILGFLLSPEGLAVAILAGVGHFVGQLVLASGQLTLSALALAGRRVSAARALRAAAGSGLRLLRFGLDQLLTLALAFAPFLGLAGLTYGLLLTRHDINYYLSEKPPAFLVAAAAGGVVGLGLLSLLTVIYVRGLFILPLMLFEGRPIREAAKESGRLTRGASWRIGAAAVGWQAAVALAAPVVAFAYAALCEWIMDRAGTRLAVLVPLASALLAGHVALVAALSFAQVAGSCLWIAEMFDERSGGRVRAWAEAVERAPAVPLRIPRLGIAAGVLAAGCGVAALAPKLVSTLTDVRGVSVTAHRGASREAPENTLAAVRRAIEIGADFVEIDVHLTSDGVPVVIHDEDLLRLAGLPKKPSELTLLEIEAVDVGSKFDAKFKGEGVPSLAALIATARGRVRLNIELKPTDRGPAREALASKVADLIRAENFESQCFVTSLDHDAVEAARRRNPRLRTGGIVSASVGDVAALDVDVLSVRAGLIDDRLLERAHRLGREVHAWTVDDPTTMGKLIDAGVDGLITNDPAAAIAVRRERTELPAWQRFVLGFRDRLSGR